MGRSPSTRVLNVFAQNELMGTLVARPNSAVEFRYHQGWLRRENAYPMSLSLPLSDEVYRAEVAAVLDNLLPDLPEVRAAIASRVRATGTDPFSLLWELGRDCVGSLQFVPASEVLPTETIPAHGQQLSHEEIGRILRSLATVPLGVHQGVSEFRISVAGAQEKTALLNIYGQWYRPAGRTPSSHILKPEIGKRGDIDLSNSVENEHLCMRLLRALGLEAAHTEVQAFDGTTALVVRRFDREWQNEQLIRLPQEDVCQALGVPSFRKYEAEGGPGMLAILDLLKLSDDPGEDRKRFLQAVYAYWLIGATDGHAKNFSLMLGAINSFRLAPLYDVVSLQPTVDAKQVSQRDHRMATAIGTNRHYRVTDIMPRHFLQTASQAGIHQSRTIAWLAEINDRLPSAIKQAQQETRGTVPDALFESITAGAMKRAALGF